MNIRRFIVGVTTITGTYIATTSTDGKAFRTCLKMEWAKYNVKINSDTDIGMICATQCQPSQWNDFLEQSYNKSLMILTENSSGSGKTTTIKQHLQQQPRLHVWISCRSLFSSSSSYWSHVLANMGLYNVRDEDIAFRIVKRVFELFQLKGVKPLIVFDDVELLLNDVKGQKLINSFREFYNENLVSIVFVSSEHHRKELSKHIGNFRTTKLNLPSNPQWELSYNYEKINSDYDEMSQTLEITGAHMGMLTNILKLPSWQRKHELKFLIDQANVHLEEVDCLICFFLAFF